MRHHRQFNGRRGAVLCASIVLFCCGAAWTVSTRGESEMSRETRPHLVRQKGRDTLLAGDDYKAISYSVIVDAGSTGCRIYIYEEGKDGVIVGTRGPKATPGLSELSPEDVASYLSPLVEFATDRVPERARSQTPFKVLATAGMRLVGASISRTIYDAVYDALEPLDFLTDRRNAHTISGEDEAYYAALAINYAYDRIDSRSRRRNNKKKSSFPTLLGALDLGGASAQIAVPSSSSSQKLVTAEDFEVATYLEYGIERVSARYHRQVGGKADECAAPADFSRCSQALAESLGIGECRRKRHQERATPDNKTCTLPEFEAEVGAAPTVAASAARSFRASSKRNRNHNKGGEELVATSLYYYAWLSLYEILKMVDANDGSSSSSPSSYGGAASEAMNDEWPKPSISSVRKSASRACGLTGEELSKLASQRGRWNPAVGDAARRATEFPRRCFDLAYVDILLTDVLGLAESERIEVSVEKGDVELDWTLGVVVDDNAHQRRQQQRLRQSGGGGADTKKSHAATSAIKDDVFDERFWKPILLLGCVFFSALFAFFLYSPRRRKKTKTDDKPCWNDSGYYGFSNSNEPGTPTSLKDLSSSSPNLERMSDPDVSSSLKDSNANNKTPRSNSPVPMDAGARSRSTSSLRLTYSNSV